MFEPVDGSERLTTLVEEVFTFVGATSFATRVMLHAALLLLGFAPMLLFASWRPLHRMDPDRRRAMLARIERSPLALVLVPWRTLLVLHLYEDARELARIGYRSERRRHLSVVAATPTPAESGVRLRDGDVDDHDEVADEQGAA